MSKLSTLNIQDVFDYVGIHKNYIMIFLVLYYSNSANHKAGSSLVTGHSQKICWLECPPEAIPIDSQWTLFCSTGIVPVEIIEWPGTVRPAAL